jgi:trimeric autotransporter adhesin
MKFILAALCLFGISFSAIAQNNTCATPVSLTQSSVCTNTSSTLQAASNDGPAVTAGCGTGTPNDVWFTFTAQSTSATVTLSSLGTSLTAANTFIQIFSGSCGSFTNVTCGNASAALTATTLTINTTYYIRVYITAATTGGANSRAFNICVTGPVNDVCSKATAITPVTTCGAVGNQSLFLANSTGSPTNTTGITNDVWYRFTTPANTSAVQIALSATGSSITNTNTYIEGFSATTCGGISTATSLATVSRNNTLTMYGLAPLTQYYFRVFTTASPTTNAANWNFSVCVSYAVAANDDCGSAISLTTGTTNSAGNILFATPSTGITAPCTGTASNDIWYSFVATRTYATVSVSGNFRFTNAKPIVEVFSGTCGSLTSILMQRFYLLL